MANRGFDVANLKNNDKKSVIIRNNFLNLRNQH